MDEQQNSSRTNTLGQAYLYGKGHIWNILRKWYLVLIGGLIFGGLMFFYAVIDQGSYVAHPVFTFESMEESGGMLSAAADMLGMAAPGVNLGGGNSINADYLIAIARSQRTLKTTLLREIKVRGFMDKSANHYANIYNLYEDEVLPPGFKFKAKSIRDSSYTRVEDSLLTKISERIKDNHLKAIYHRETLRLVELIIASKSRGFTINFSKELIKEVEKYFTENQIKRESETVNTLEKRADSLQQRLHAAEYALARWQDTRNRMIKARGSLDEVRLRRNVEILSILNAEVLANLEAAKFSKLQNTPLIYSIDEPEFALEFKKRPIIPFTAAGMGVGFILASLVILTRKAIKDSLDYHK
ncbi:MAG: hypothetical protein HKN92_04310 [Chitinophagales bacterium]|nr:hypothetical protein [Chitinophagales bacterium]